MENILPLEDTRGVPLKVDIETGPNWAEMESASTS
jgi:DNA polymerase I-like protein with 3'-5' exonuclease and polymerase domains